MNKAEIESASRNIKMILPAPPPAPRPKGRLGGVEVYDDAYPVAVMIVDRKMDRGESSPLVHINLGMAFLVQW